MFEVTRKGNSCIFTLTSDISILTKVMEEFDRFIKRYDFVDHHGMAIVLRELLINAIVHGNKERLESIVTCRIDGIEGKKFKIEVEDEGSGFNYKSINMDIPEDPRALKSRGYILINALSNRIIFKGKGNHVIVYIDMSDEGRCKEMKDKVIETRTAKIRLRAEGFIHVELLSGSELELDDAKELLAAECKLAGGEKKPLLIDIRKIKAATREAREHFADEKPTGFIASAAILIESPQSRALGNLYIGINKPPFPVRLFNSEKEAIRWLIGSHK